MQSPFGELRREQEEPGDRVSFRYHLPVPECTVKDPYRPDERNLGRDVLYGQNQEPFPIGPSR